LRKYSLPEILLQLTWRENNRPNAAVERKLTQQHRLLQPPWTHLAVRRQHGGGQGDVVSSINTVQMGAAILKRTNTGYELPATMLWPRLRW
jgi:hypothetical protein